MEELIVLFHSHELEPLVIRGEFTDEIRAGTGIYRIEQGKNVWLIPLSSISVITYTDTTKEKA